MTGEVSKPNADRLREYRDSNLESLKFQLFSPAPIYPAFERVRFQQSLSFMAEQLGAEHPLVVKVLGGKSPPQRVDSLIEGTKLADVDERKKLVAGSAKALDDSRDPLVVFARDIDGEAASCAGGSKKRSKSRSAKLTENSRVFAFRRWGEVSPPMRPLPCASHSGR